VILATRHTLALWGEGRSQADHTAYTLEQFARGGPELLRYVGMHSDDGRLIASSKRYALAIQAPDGTRMRAVGIGAVMVPQAERGGGASLVMLRAMMEEGRDLGYDAALLYSNIDPGFYTKLGFVTLPAKQHIATLEALPAKGALTWRLGNAEDP